MATIIVGIVGSLFSVAAIGISVWVAVVAKSNLTLSAYSTAIGGGILNLKSTFAEHAEIFERQMERNSDIAPLIPDYMNIPEFLAFAGGMWRFSYVFSVMSRRRSLGLSQDQYVGLRNEMELWLENVPGFYDVYRTHTSKLGAHDPSFLAYLAREVYTEEFRCFADAMRAYGPDSREVLEARNQLAVSYQNASRPDKAFPAFERALKDCSRMFGSEDELTQTVQANLTDARASASHAIKRDRRRPWPAILATKA